MRQWFPFTDYDFYACIIAGTILIAAIDFTFAGQILISRADWTIAQAIFWIGIAYVLGQLIAGPSAALVEHLVARTFLYQPLNVLLGFRKPRFREKFVFLVFGGSYYRPLPPAVLSKLATKAKKDLRTRNIVVGHSEAIFQIAFANARKMPDAAARVDQFRNLYGFTRNVTFVAFVALVLLCARAYLNPLPLNYWLAAAALVVMLGMFGRFMIFYSAFTAEVLRTYAFSSSKDKKQ